MSDPVLITIWFAIICLEIGLYIILDGADLGLGVLSLLPGEEKDRALIMHTIGPIWDANETWIVIAGGTLFGAFPQAYGVILNALYIPVMLMLFGLILRAVSFEFHAFSINKRPWSFLFGFGSLIAVLGQGGALGGLLSGIAIENGRFAGHVLDFITPLTAFITLGILASYAVVGYAYLIKKTGREFKATFLRVMGAAGLTFIALLGATLILPQENHLFFTRWTTEPTNGYLFAIVGAIGTLSLFLAYGAVFKKYTHLLHSICMLIFVCAALGLLMGVFPYIAPPSLTIFDAAASRGTLTFMLWGMGPLIPIVLAYNFYLYRVFADPAHASRAESYGE